MMKKCLTLMLITFILFSITSCWKAQLIGGPVQQNLLTDGTYEGQASHGPNSAKVVVTIVNQTIETIEVVKNEAWKGKKAVPEIPDRIIARQSTRVDAVSGATNSSHVLMNAVENALKKAYKKSDSY